MKVINRIVISGNARMINKLREMTVGTCCKKEYFDFNGVVLMPELVAMTEPGWEEDCGLLLHGHDPNGRRIGEDAAMQYLIAARGCELGTDTDSVRSWINSSCPNAYRLGELSLRCFCEHGVKNHVHWAIANWGVQTNPTNYQEVFANPEVWAFTFWTTDVYPEPIYRTICNEFAGLALEAVITDAPNVMVWSGRGKEAARWNQGPTPNTDAEKMYRGILCNAISRRKTMQANGRPRRLV